MNINWNNIRPINNSLNDGFEELVCQLARHEHLLHQKQYIRKGKPDAGVECYWILDNGDELAWQAKFFTASLSSTQWGEIDKSVRTVINKHPNLKKYIIAISYDPPDARRKGQSSTLDKWNNHVEKWTNWAKAKNLKVEFIPWWSSDLIERLAKPENTGLLYFFFNKEEFTNQWFKEQTELAISDLGNRYTPKLNIELDIARNFDGLSRNQDFKNQFNKIINELLIAGNKVLPNKESLTNNRKLIQQKLDEVKEIYQSITVQGIGDIPIDALDTKVTELESHVQDVYQYYINEEKNKKNKNSGYYTKFGSEIHHSLDLFSKINKLSDFIKSNAMKLANNPFLILKGGAGIGKSHLLADIVINRSLENLNSIFLLGQHFVTNENPWSQILKNLNLNCSLDEFLGSLNAKAQITKSRVIIFIDALNEGDGKYFWKDNLNAFITKIKSYKWLGLVLSIRESYIDTILPPQVIKNQTIITHYGFDSNLNEATQLFFNNYQIDLPSVPLLHPEFSNPLFLKTFCEGLKNSGMTRIPDGFHGISSVIDLFIQSINTKLAEPNILDFDPSLNIVRITIEALLTFKMENELSYIPYSEALQLTVKIQKQYGITKDLLNELVSNGVLSKNLYRLNNSNQEGIYLAYERFDDHLLVSSLIEQSTDLTKDFQTNGELYDLVKDEQACRFNKGLLEAFAIQLPEKSNVELHDLVPHLKDTLPIIDCFIESLLWRKTDTLSEKLTPYINNHILSYNKHTYEKFTDTLIAVTSIPNHYFNANFMHTRLMKFSMADRDGWWTQFLKEQTFDENAVNRLIKWAWVDEDKSYISNESLKLCSMTIAWFFTSTNRKLRDSSTKALVCLLQNRIKVLIELLKEFEKVNDPYVYERLFAVAYGCTLRTKQQDKLADLSHYIFQTIFSAKGETYPHILLRDYARGIIEYSNYLGHNLLFDIKKARPPYKSKFYKRFPTNQYIDGKYKLDYKADGFKKHYWSQNNILDSMTTEYGRGVGGYGDFGRYVFQSAFRDFDVKADKLSNLAVKWIFTKYGYDKDKHGKFDRDLGAGRGVSKNNNERIGKKYQWIALHEMLARVADNCVKYGDGYPKTIKKFEGPWWSPNVRDIDPTNTIEMVGNSNVKEYKSYWWQKALYNQWSVENKKWIEQDDFPEPKNIINVIDDDKVEWLVLSGFPEWSEPIPLGQEKFKISSKVMFYSISSYLVSEVKFDTLKKYLSSLDDFGGKLPELLESYSIFNNEYYRSPAYNYFRKYLPKYYDVKIDDENVIPVTNTTEQYYWSKDLDMSKEGVITFLKPSKYIFQQMKMKNNSNDGYMKDNNNMICFDPSIQHDCKLYLLINKKLFIKFLKDNKLKIIWTLHGAKQIVGSRMTIRDYKTSQDIIGVYYFDGNNNITGSKRVKQPK